MKRISLYTKHLLGLLLISLVVFSCKKNAENTEVAPVSGKISYVVTANSSSGSTKKVSAVVDSSKMNIAVNWSSATIWVEKISFIAQSSRLLDTTVIVGKKLNIFSGDALAGIIRLPAGSYKDVKVKMYCRKSPQSDYAFDFQGTFSNTKGGTDSLRIGSSLPFEANLAVTNIVIDPSDNYKATFNFNLSNTLTGITIGTVERVVVNRIGKDNKKSYVIWKGGSAEEPLYNEIIANWQTVASVNISKGGAGSAE